MWPTTSIEFLRATRVVFVIVISDPKMFTNLPNLITLSRIPLLLLTVTLLFFESRWGATVAVFIYALASLTDWLDGYIARKWRLESTFGAFMDALIDKIFTIGVFITMLVVKILPDHALFAVIVIISREFTITGLRAVAADQQVVIPAQSEGKVKTALQMISTGFLLLFFALKRDFYHIYTLEDVMWVYYVGYASFVTATLVTLESGIVYLVRFKHVLSESAAVQAGSGKPQGIPTEAKVPASS
jgi:CDP-diacylglycerol--glycerol-3-phosphate 3-phosphatidyltransferase